MIAEILLTGERNGKKAPEIMALTGLPDSRSVTRQVSIERRNVTDWQGFICSGNNGYFMPEKLDDVRRCVKSLKKRSKSLFFILQPVNIILDQCEGQQELSNLKGSEGNKTSG
jgi:hypothetical protein